MKKLLLTIIFCLLAAYTVSAAELPYQICVPGVCMGTVEWESTPGTNYKIRDDLRLKRIGIKKFDVKPGWYGITIWSPGTKKILEFINIEIRDMPLTVRFCR